MNISQIDFSNLRLDTEEPKIIKHHPNYIKEGTGVNATRRIFYGVPFDVFEVEKIRELTRIINKLGLGLPTNWTDADLLKYLYAAKFSYEKAINMIQSCLQWRSDPASWKITNKVKAIFESGTIYINGRDKQLRPILVIDLGQLYTLNVTDEDLNAAGTIMMDVLIENCFVPGKVENAALVVMSNNLSVNKLPQSLIKSWITLGNFCFPHCIDKIYVVRPPLIDKISIKVAEAFMEKDTAAKIQIVEYENLARLQNWISPSQLEKKLGGSEPNMTKFWPPVQTARTKSTHAAVGFSQTVQSTGKNNKHLTKGNDKFDFTLHHLDDPSPIPRFSEPYSSASQSPDLMYRATTSGRIRTSPGNSPSRQPESQHRSTVSARMNTTESYNPNEPLLIIDDHPIGRVSVQEKAVRSSVPVGRDEFFINSPSQMKQRNSTVQESPKRSAPPMDSYQVNNTPPHMRQRNSTVQESPKRSSPPTNGYEGRASTSGKAFGPKVVAEPAFGQGDIFTEADRRQSYTRQSPSKIDFSDAERRPSVPSVSRRTYEQIDSLSDTRQSLPAHAQDIVYSKKPVSMGYHEEFIRDVIFGQPGSTRNSEARRDSQQPVSTRNSQLQLQKKKSYTLEDESAGLRSSDRIMARGNSSAEKAKKSRAPVTSVEFVPSVTDIEQHEDEKVVFDSNVFDSEKYLGDNEDQRLLHMIAQENREINKNYKGESRTSLLYFDPRDKPSGFDALNIKQTTSENFTIQSSGLDTNHTRGSNTFETAEDEKIERWSKVKVRRELQTYNEEAEHDVPGDFCGIFFSSKPQQVVNK